MHTTGPSTPRMTPHTLYYDGSQDEAGAAMVASSQ